MMNVWNTAAAELIPEVTADAANTAGKNFAPAISNFVKNLPYLAEGMIGIAIAMGIIIGMICLLNKIFQKD